MRTMTDYEALLKLERKLVKQEELILAVTESLAEALNTTGMKKIELASKLGVTKGFVTQVLGGGRNLTLRTIADVADALDHSVVVCLRPRFVRFKDSSPLVNWRGAQETLRFNRVPREANNDVALTAVGGMRA